MTNPSLYVKDFHMTIQTPIKAVEQNSDNVMITDKAGIIQYGNPVFQRTTGYSKAEVLGKAFRFFIGLFLNKELMEAQYNDLFSLGKRPNIDFH